MMGRMLGGLLPLAGVMVSVAAQAGTFTTIALPSPNNSIETNLIAQVPTGTLVSTSQWQTPFAIASSPATCGYTGHGACNFYDAFSPGSSLTINVGVFGVTNVHTLMNAYGPKPGDEVATVTFYGSAGTVESVNLISGSDIRNFYVSNNSYNAPFSYTLSNSTAGVTAEQAFLVTNVTGSAGSGNVTTGYVGNYALDEQNFTLASAFLSETLTKVVITDDSTSSIYDIPIIAGLTTESVPEPATLAVAAGALGLALKARKRA